MTSPLPRSQPGSEHSPTPWELVEATEHHGPYICNVYGGDVCDLYAMSNPGAFSTRNGGNSYPVPFTDADANAAFIVEAVNSHAAFKKALQWIADNEGAHPHNVAMVARDALAPSLEGRGGAT